MAANKTSKVEARKKPAGALDASMNPNRRPKLRRRRSVFDFLADAFASEPGGEGFYSRSDAPNENITDNISLSDIESMEEDDVESMEEDGVESMEEDCVESMEKDGGFMSSAPIKDSLQEIGKDSEVDFLNLKASPCKLDAMGGSPRMSPKSGIKDGNIYKKLAEYLRKALATNIDDEPTPTSMSPMSVPSSSSIQKRSAQSLPSTCGKKMRFT